MSSGCDRHALEQAVGECRHCGGSFCRLCLVHVFGSKRPPLCVPCALWAGGVAVRRPPRRRTESGRRRVLAFAARRRPAAVPTAGTTTTAAPAVTAANLRDEFAQPRKPVVLERAPRQVVDLSDDGRPEGAADERARVSSLAG